MDHLWFPGTVSVSVSRRAPCFQLLTSKGSSEGPFSEVSSCVSERLLPSSVSQAGGLPMPRALLWLTKSRRVCGPRAPRPVQSRCTRGSVVLGVPGGVRSARLTQGHVPWLSNGDWPSRYSSTMWRFTVRKRVRPPKLMCQVELRDSTSFGTCLRWPGGAWAALTKAPRPGRVWVSPWGEVRDAWCWGTLRGTPCSPSFISQCLLFYPQMDWVLSESRMPGIWPVGPAMHIPAETNELFSNPHGLPASAIFFFFSFLKILIR